MTAARYARHELIPGWDQSGLRAARVVLIGVGALGNEVARLLAMAGVGRLTLVDPDVVAESNLSRCVLFRSSDVGRPKVEAAAATLGVLAPETVLAPRQATLTSGAGLAELRDATLVISALDSMAARIELAARCTSVGAALLDAGTRPWGGEVRYYPPGGACYACPLTPAERAVLDDPWSCGQLASPIEAGASGPVSAMVAGWQATTAVRLLFGLPVAELTSIDAQAGAASGPGPKRDADCPCHDVIPAGIVSRARLTAEDTVADLLKRIEPGEDVLTWGGQPDLPGALPSRAFLGTAQRWRSLAQLGVAPGEILTVRSASGGTLRYIELSTTSEEPRR